MPINNQRQQGPGGFGGPGGPGGPGGFGGRGRGPGGPGGFGGRPGGPRRPGGPGMDRDRDEFKDRVLDMRRVTRVMAGGKRFRFRATVAIGDMKGRVGVGVGKGVDVQQAVAKAKADAKKNLLRLELKDDRTLYHEASAKYSAAQVLVKPAKAGHGLKAGGAPRVVLNLAGVKDATAKCISRTPNKLTNALATMKALRQIKNRKVVPPSVATAASDAE